MYKLNKVNIVGTIIQAFELSNTQPNVYSSVLSIKRMSGYTDVIPIEIQTTEDLTKTLNVGTKVLVKGELISYSVSGHLKIYISAKTIFKIEDSIFDTNIIEITGYICKPPIFRITPFGKRICDLFIAVPITCEETSYVPCILWGKFASYASNLKIGMLVNIEGRIQSREYIKKTDFEILKKTAIEVSGSLIKKI